MKAPCRILRNCIVLLWLFLASIAGIANAHEIRPAVTSVTFTADGRYNIDIALNVEAMLAGVSPQHRDTNESPNAKRYDALRALPPDALRPQVEAFVPKLLEDLRVEFDGARVTPVLAGVDIPPVGDVAISRLGHLRFAGAIPPGAKTFRWSYPAALGANVLRLQRPQDAEVTAVWLKEGTASEAFPLEGALAAKSTVDVGVEYGVLGFTHILPKGLDHILFVLGLFLLSAKLKPLLVQVTAFTIAHSITLGLTIYGIFSLPSTIVEPLIAASIVYVAAENVATSTLHVWRPFVVFAFGLLHGMGFAGVLQEIGLPSSQFLTALITFNVGVELGQLAVIVLALLLIGWGRNKSWYRQRVVIPASLVISLVGLYWTFERVLG